MVPDQMNAVLSDARGGPLALGTIPVPRPGRGEVLVRMAAAPINPSDLRLISGPPGSELRPIVPGLEGSGTVVEAGGGLLARLLVGRRVALASSQGGTWAEYATAAASRCIPLLRHVSLEQGATLIVNPLTVLAFFDIARRDGHRAIINNAAASALGRMIVRLGQRTRISVINIVGRAEQTDVLKALGAEYVLDSSDPGFPSALRELAQRLRATLALDAVGGSQTQTLLASMPVGATLVAYAALAGEPSAFNPRTVIGDDKKIVGFYLGTWMARRGLVRMAGDIVRVQRLIGTDLQSPISRRVPLSAAQAALEAYRANMSAGKVLLVADPEQVRLQESAKATG